METKVRVTAKASGERVVDVLGAPFGSATDKDAQGEYFTPETDFWLSDITVRPIIYGHGFKAMRPQMIGSELGYRIDEEGVWFEVSLNDAEEAERVYQAALIGHAKASTGAISHLVRSTPDGRLLSWPIAELSLVDEREFSPANIKARVEIAGRKALYGEEMVGRLEAGERARRAMPAAKAIELRARAFLLTQTRK